MIYPLLPDVDALVTGALRAGLPGATVRVLWPEQWAGVLPLVVVRRVGGVGQDARGIDSAIIDVQCAARTRREASLLARRARVVLAEACATQYRGVDGYLTHFADVSGPHELRTGAPSAGPDLFRFQATYRVICRPFVGRPEQPSSQ
ncbi:hypothetical protein M1P56_21385 [Streptomyces sp. HU2014]|uniref:hypothetical protein n=1 Tax=Streptomyces sp. HU2014 TaxID=2939414 RepID=UPI00200ED350|nr:hypothetical protein [Streptomyces sp. HU2014]UQI46720.1 hypothetical protein M1P56_21385 [Streptomyces sp. HU2014]